MPDARNSLRSAPAWLELPGRQTFVIKGDCHIGRTADNEIVNPDTRISRRNSVVQRAGNHFVLVDLGSTNGTYLNGLRIYKPTRLKDHDAIMVGSESYVFRQPPEPDGPASDAAESEMYRTAVAVGVISCWMLRAAAPASSGSAGATWIEQVRNALVAGGAGVRLLPGAVLFAHWRAGRAAPEAVRAAILKLWRLALPPGASVAVHHGAVRVGPAAAPGEETLIGADVAFTHQLTADAVRLGTGLVLSEAAVRTLGLASTARALVDGAAGDPPNRQPLFTLQLGEG